MTITATEQITYWNVEPTESSVEFTIKTFWGLATVHGRFDRFDGVYVIGSDETTIALVVDANSLDTGNRTRDRHLRSDDFFNVEKQPLLRFTSTRVHRVTEDCLHVVGDLQVAGKSVSLEFPATVGRLGDQLEIEATTTVDPEELGMSRGTLGMIRRPATLHITARLVQS